MKEIALSGKNGKGKFALVNDDMYDFLNKWTWHVDKDGYSKRKSYLGTIVDENGNKKRVSKDVLMHREVLNPSKDFIVDHINGNPLDNRRENLRECNQQQNQWNSKGRPNSSSKYKGVVNRKYGYEVSYTNVDGKLIYVGKFSNEIAAANAYNHYAKLSYGEYARLNDVPFMNKEEWEKHKNSLNKGKSKYTGVHWSKKVDKWEATLYIKGKQKFIGYFNTEEDAVLARNRLIIENDLDVNRIQKIIS